MSDTISIAMTTYNGERFLREQLDSLYRQSLMPTEIIVCDDASTDSTTSILEEYKQNHGLTYFVNKARMGYNANFYQAISLCHGNYIALCDQDDVWQEDKLLKTYQTMKKVENGPTAVSTQVVETDTLLQPLPARPTQFISQEPIYSILFDGYSQGCTLLINQALKEAVLPIVSAHQDLQECFAYDAVIGIIAASIGTKYNMPDSTMYYRRHQQNALGNLIDHHYTSRQLMNLRPRYHHFTKDARLEALNLIYRYFSESMPEDIRSIYHIAEKMRTAPHLWQGLREMYRLPLPVKKKLEVTLYSTANAILKCLHK